MARVATIIALPFIVLALVAPAAWAQDRARMDDPFEITADEIRYDAERDLYIADGRVRVVQGGRKLRAAWVVFSETSRLGVAEGGVELIEAKGEDRNDQLSAQFMVFDVDSLQGLLYQGALDAGTQGFRAEAKELARTGRNTFALRESLFTTCRCEEGDRIPWALRANKANVELGGYGTIQNSTFEVLGVPVLWIPWAFFPVKSERETGLLLPSFSFGGRGGIGAGLPIFWAAHDQVNLTATPTYFSERGYKQDLELEYVFGEQSEGSLFLAGLLDQQGEIAARRERGAVIWRHDQFLPMKWRWQTDLRLASDNIYTDDFNELRDFNSFRYMESTMSLARDFGASGGYGALVGARYADDVQGSTFEDRDEYLLQRWTELRGDIQPGTLQGPLGFEARFDSELIYFAGLRSPESTINNLDPAFSTARPLKTDGRFFDLGFDGRFNPFSFALGAAGNSGANGENDGIFQPGEPLAERGVRIVLHPRVSRTFDLGSGLEVVPEVGWQQTLYQTNGQRFAERGLLTGRLEARSRLVRDFELDGGGLLRHVLEPKLGWALVSSTRQKKNPLFVPAPGVEQTRLRTLSLENVTRNPSDRTESANQIVLGLGQRFFTADQAYGVPRLRGDLTTAIDWDFADGGGLGNIAVEGRVFPIGPVWGRVRAAFDPEAAAFEEGGAQLTLFRNRPDSFLRRASITGGYRYVRRPPRFFETDLGNASSFSGGGESEINQVDFQVQFELAWRVRFTYSAIYGLVQESRGFIRNRGVVEYVSKCECWGVGVSIDHENRDGFQGGFMLRFLGLGDGKGNLFDSGLGTGLNF